jgi:plasmid stabilization system protein ParE
LSAALSREARKDLLEILEGIRAQNPFAAEKMAQEFMRKFRILALQPGIGTGTKNENVRVLPVRRNYRVFYRSPPPALIIQRVIHAARHWPDAELPEGRAQ